jgi:PadR family transcriptional regulator PadR
LARLEGKKIMRDILLAFVRVHILHHATEERIFGLAMMDELKRHGYDIGPGTLYPMLHALEKSGALTSTRDVRNGKVRKYYRTTNAGDALLGEMRAKIGELVDEVLPRHSQRKQRKSRAR